ncbi:MAG: sialate O-acetylesterase [Armatimonadota bacterium]
MPLQLHSMFSDHLVLQQGMPAPVWGCAEAGDTVNVTMAGRSAQTVVKADGSWKVTLPAMTAGGPYDMMVYSGGTMLTVRDVLVGEVWVCSGQSNMEWPLSLANDAEAEVAAADYPQIRLFTVPKIVVLEPKSEVDSTWTVCTPDNATNFSAVAYFFGRHLHQELGVPIGLINTSWGGTVAEAWTSYAGLQAEPALSSILEALDYGIAHYDELNAKYLEDYAAWQQGSLPVDTGNAGCTQGWANPATPTTDWETMKLPDTWQHAGHNISGVFWFRKTVEIPAAWAGKDLSLHIGACDKSEVTYFNNVQVGSLTLEDRADSWSIPRVYTVPGNLVHAGENLIAVRVFSHMYAGGMIGPTVNMFVSPADDPAAESIGLAGSWHYNIEQDFGFVQPPSGPPAPYGPANANTPTGLFNGMISPLLPYALRGAIWYQGESNADRGYQYRTLFPAMIRDWRKQWGHDLSFYFVQLANYMVRKDEPVESRWAELREAQTMTLQEPNTGMAVIIDIGEAADIHPRNKQDVGYRLALNALAQDYGKTDLVCSGPLFTGAQVEGNAIRLSFDHIGEGLVCHGEKLTSFTIAGTDRQFVNADAVIDGDTIVVSSPQVPAPIAVRYGWEDNPACHLYNQAGLPASPFRTDDWVAPEMAEQAALQSVK